METPELAPDVLAQVSRELAVKARTSGPVILGSQLGKMINHALLPRHLREFHGWHATARSFTTAAKLRCGHEYR